MDTIRKHVINESPTTQVMVNTDANFGKEFYLWIKEQFSDSTMIGGSWESLSPEERAKWTALANALLME